MKNKMKNPKIKKCEEDGYKSDTGHWDSRGYFAANLNRKEIKTETNDRRSSMFTKKIAQWEVIKQNLKEKKMKNPKIKKCEEDGYKSDTGHWDSRGYFAANLNRKEKKLSKI
jgi:BRCT domain type II-containing protein